MAGIVLGHGAGGGIGSPDLVGAAEAAVSAGLSVALVEQPYRVAGRRSPAPASQLDAAWTTVVLALRDGPLGGLPILTGGRSSGARVACRTAAETESVAVVCLAFPLHPPGRPDADRGAEARDAGVDLLVVQGERDPFGTPAEVGRAVPAARVVAVPFADHGMAVARSAPVTQPEALGVLVAGASRQLAEWARRAAR